jgi:hypothetical protein
MSDPLKLSHFQVEELVMQRLFSSLDRKGNVVNVVRDLPPTAKIPQRAAWDPMGLPADSKQCVHVEWQDDPKIGVGYPYRCTKPSTKGFLCGFHDYNVLDLPQRTKGVKPAKRDFDQEQIDQIRKTEEEALFVSYSYKDEASKLIPIEREVVRLSAKGAKIQFVKDLRMEADPDQIVLDGEAMFPDMVDRSDWR